MRSSKSAANYRICTWRNDFLRTACGETTIEYALIAAGVAVAVAGIIYVTGADVTALFQSISDAFTGV